MIAATVPRAVTILASFLLARILGQNGFGEYGVINSTVGMVSTFSGLGLGATIVKHLAEFKTTDPQRAGRIYTLTTIINWISALIYAIVFVLLAPWLASETLAAPHLAPMLQISAISLAMGTINSLQQNVLTGLEAFRTSALITIITSTIQSIILLLAAYIWELKGVISGLALNSLIIAFVYFYAIKNEKQKFNIQFFWLEARKEWEVLLKFSLPAFLGGILVGPAFWGANAILANQKNGYAELGLLNAAGQWQQVIQFIPTVLGAALLPIMAEKYGNNDKIGSYYLMKKMILVYAKVVIPIAILLSLLSPFIMRAYGPSFEVGYLTLIIILFTAALAAIMTPVGNMIAASGKMWIGFFTSLIWGICMIGGSYIFAELGSIGIACARFLSYFIQSFFILGFAFWLKKKLN